MTTAEKAGLILRDVRGETTCDPYVIFTHVLEKGYVNMHGPEHHILDGACLLTAYRNAGGAIDLDAALDKLCAEGLRMPGAMCGLWGVCGAVASMGAALAIIDGTGPLTTDGSWGDHMAFTAAATAELGRVNGPRCCKRDAFLAFRCAVDYIGAHKGVRLTWTDPVCRFSPMNAQCIGAHCPFHASGDRQ